MGKRPGWWASGPMIMVWSVLVSTLLAGSVIALVKAGGFFRPLDVGNPLAEAYRRQAAFIEETLPRVLHETNVSGKQEDGLTAVESDLREAALTEEFYFAERGEYTTTMEELTAQGFEVDEGVTVSIILYDEEHFCLEGTHEDIAAVVLSYDSDLGRVEEQTCP